MTNLRQCTNPRCDHLVRDPRWGYCCNQCQGAHLSGGALYPRPHSEACEVAHQARTAAVTRRIMRHGELVEREFTTGLTAKETVEKTQLEAELDADFAWFYEPMIARLTAMVTLLRLFQIPNTHEVGRFLKTRLALAPVLVEAHAQVRHFFPDEPLTLAMEKDPEDPPGRDAQLVLAIEATGDVREIFGRLTAFDDAWGTNAMAEADLAFLVTVRLVGGA